MLISKSLIKKNTTIVYILTDSNFESLYQKLVDCNCSIVFVEVEDWNNELSCWPLRALKSTFAGNADESIKQLELLVKEVEQDMSISSRILIGYSLAGLFSLYTLTKSELFNKAGCCSSSFWYPNFVDYLKESCVKNKTIYFSLGDKEALSKNALLSQVEVCTVEIYEHLKDNNNCILEFNKGNHFVEVDERMLKAINWLIKD